MRFSHSFGFSDAIDYISRPLAIQGENTFLAIIIRESKEWIDFPRWIR
jgi:hypothetical protein